MEWKASWNFNLKRDINWRRNSMSLVDF